MQWRLCQTSKKTKISKSKLGKRVTGMSMCIFLIPALASRPKISTRFLFLFIPLRKEAKLIFSEQFGKKLPKLTNPEFNKHIKTIGKLAGLCETIKFSYKKGNKSIEVIKPKFNWITSHTARRSFCTNEFLAGTPVKLIMKISGHKNEKDFYKYIRVTPEEAAQKIKDLWQERNDLNVFENTFKKVS